MVCGGGIVCVLRRYFMCCAVLSDGESFSSVLMSLGVVCYEFFAILGGGTFFQEFREFGQTEWIIFPIFVLLTFFGVYVVCIPGENSRVIPSYHENRRTSIVSGEFGDYRRMSMPVEDDDDDDDEYSHLRSTSYVSYACDNTNSQREDSRSSITSEVEQSNDSEGHLRAKV